MSEGICNVWNQQGLFTQDISSNQHKKEERNKHWPKKEMKYSIHKINIIKMRYHFTPIRFAKYKGY